MPSPFPGMDPYLEAPAIWPDFHDAFAGEIRSELNRTLPAPYYARLEMRPEVGISASERGQRKIVPDVAVVRPPRDSRAQPAAVALEQPRTEISTSYEVNVLDEPLRHHFVEIRDPAQGHKLITLIEIASPSNKRRGADRDAYHRKQREVAESDASLIEIDLLRSGERLISDPHLLEFLTRLEAAPDYLVLVNRVWGRSKEGTRFQVFAFSLREMLPCVPVPLRQGEAEVPLDLQYLLNRAYDGGPYQRGAVDYAGAPDPPLRQSDEAWAAQVLRTLRDSEGGNVR